LAIGENWSLFRNALKRRAAIIAVAFLVVFSLSVASVFWVRVQIYYGYASGAPQEEPFTSHLLRTIRKQLPNLLIHRWIGLEGVLAVGAAPGRGRELFFEAISDNPNDGAKALYARITNVIEDPHYAGKFTFMSNAGIVAVLLYSGSLAVVAAGMAAVALVLFMAEYLARRCTGNPFFVAVAGAGIANVVVQTTFPYLTAIFLLQLWCTIALVGLLHHPGLDRLLAK
jgi:hypothetical protein